jgi:hypothetical protein
VFSYANARGRLARARLGKQPQARTAARAVEFAFYPCIAQRGGGSAARAGAKLRARLQPLGSAVFLSSCDKQRWPLSQEVGKAGASLRSREGAVRRTLTIDRLQAARYPHFRLPGWNGTSYAVLAIVWPVNGGERILNGEAVSA